MASLAVSSALWMTATSANPIGAAGGARVRARHRLRQVADRRVGARAGRDPAAAAGASRALSARACARRPTRPRPRAPRCGEMGPLSRDERITAVAFALMVAGWIFADTLKLNVTSIAFAGLGVLLMTERAHARRHRRAGRHARHVPLARRALRAERPAERARLHGLRRPAPRGAARAACRGR